MTMIRRLLPIVIFLFLFSIPVSAQYTKLSGFCQDGNKTVTTSGIVSTTKVQQSFPLCTVTVHDTIGGALSTIYSDATGTALSNPTTAAADGQWFFYGIPTGRYDIQFSNGGITTPFTIADQSPPPGTNLALINAQNYSGLGTWERIVQAAASSACSTGCAITDGQPNTHTETITSTFTGLTISSVPVSVLLHGRYTFTGAAISGGLIHIEGTSGSNSGSNGSIVSCDTAISSILTFALPNDSLPCGITYTPSSSSGPVINLDENSGELSSIQISNITFVVNSNVTDVIQMNATGGGMADIQLNGNTVINSSTTQSWSGYAVALRCNNAGVAQNAQYSMNFYRLGVYGNGSAINGGAGGTTSGGILLNPTAGTGCGFVGPVHMNQIWMEGLTGTYGIYGKGAIGWDINRPVINSNNLAANGHGIHWENGSNTAGIIISNCSMEDNNWSNNSGVIDIAIPSGAGVNIQNCEFAGGSAGTTHAEDHAIDIGAGVVGAQIVNNSIINYKTYGTVITAGATGIVYGGNIFSVGNGAATEFKNLSSIMNQSYLLVGAGTDVTNCIVNQSFGVRNFCWDTDTSGNFKLNMNGSARLTFNGSTKATFVDSPIIPFNADSGANIPLVMGFTGTQDVSTLHIVRGTATLNGASPSTAAVTLSGNAVFNSFNTYECVASDNSVGTGTAINIRNTSGTVFTAYGPNSSVDQINIICVGF